MAGFRTFATGEVLTAANVNNFLMKQSVQKYADAAARDAALGTAVAGGNALREGMVAWLDDTDSVIAYDGSAWNPVGAEPPAGIGSNVVQTVKTSTFSTTSATYVDVTGLSVTITPSSDTSRILVIASGVVGSSNGGSGGAHLRIEGGNLNFVGNASASKVQAAQGITRGDGAEMNANYLSSTFSISVIDSPATTSAVTFDLQLRRGGAGTAFIGRSGNDANNADYGLYASSVIAIEVAA